MSNGGSLGHSRGDKGRDAFRTISEVADQLDLQQHVLRFWESKFSQIKPLKRGGNRRYYRPDDVTLITVIKKLLHSDGYTIKGVQKLFKAQGVKATITQAMDPYADYQPASYVRGALQAKGNASGEAVPVKAETQSPVELSREDGRPVAAAEGTTNVDASSLISILAQLKSIRARLA
ncbi:MAG: MerR family transcriptional regulator [Kordiimonadales bacterium]|nr:MAG: MerR family transcriptional regulator [Kordiimonadales bacterium]